MKAMELARLVQSVGDKSRLHSKSPFKIAEGANRRRKLVLTPDFDSYVAPMLSVYCDINDLQSFPIEG
jgi:hypothetical protein